MWNRNELKTKGKKSFMANYWMSVLAGLILTIVLSFSGGDTVKVTKTINLHPASSIEANLESNIDSYFDNLETDLMDPAVKDQEEAMVRTILQDTFRFLHSNQSWILPLTILAGIAATLFGMFGLLLNIFLMGPLEIGGRRYYLKNLHENTTPREFGWSFSTNYLNIVKIMFFRGLFTFLWTLLLVIPGLIKRYEYRMIPYLLAEDPDMSQEEAFARSKEMMTGNKWDAFLLDLSFIGWMLLDAITFGILGIFYVNPYRYSTCAALYEALKTRKEEVVSDAYYVEVE